MMCKSITVLFIDNYCVSHDILIRVGELMSRRDRTNRCEDPYPNEYYKATDSPNPLTSSGQKKPFVLHIIKNQNKELF